MKVLIRKLIGLGRDEDGAALVITLALLMFMYVTCAGVLAIGQSVKDRIHLQNACDAAAYSAAVVQADTLSRIATINKAMSWTYVSMTRRQMDCIVYRWLEHSIAHYDRDEKTARDWYRNSHCGAHGMSALVLNGHDFDPRFIQSRDMLETWLGQYSHVHLNRADNVESCYAESIPLDIDKLQAQISVDKQTIDAMNKAEIRLIDGDQGNNCPSLKERMDAAAKETLRINLQDAQKYRYFIADAGMGGFDSDQCFKKEKKYLTLSNTEKDETRFLGWSDKGPPKSTFGRGNDVWFFRDDNGPGLHRTYRRDVAGNPLYATWDWWSWRCIGHDMSGNPIRDYRATHLLEPECRECDHVYRRCWCESNTYYPSPFFKDNVAVKYTIRSPLSYSAISYADTIYDASYFDGQRAYPLILSDKYFGSAGTITVGLAKYNENPWARVFGPKTEVSRNGMDRLAGIFAAFNPYKHVEWSWAFSSAKAGYREKGGEYDGTRAYRVDWDSQDPSWNLCVSDWDAVFVPVRSACMEAKDGSWKLTSGNNDFLKKWVESGDWKAFDGFNPPQYDLARNGMPRLPRMHNARGTIHDINWTRLRDMLYH